MSTTLALPVTRAQVEKATENTGFGRNDYDVLSYFGDATNTVLIHTEIEGQMTAFITNLAIELTGVTDGKVDVVGLQGNIKMLLSHVNLIDRGEAQQLNLAFEEGV